jgi:hypothetical protein
VWALRVGIVDGVSDVPSRAPTADGEEGRDSERCKESGKKSVTPSHGDPQSNPCAAWRRLPSASLAADGITPRGRPAAHRPSIQRALRRRVARYAYSSGVSGRIPSRT